MWVNQEDYEVVGEALAHARDVAGMTQVEVARILRKPQSFVSNFERGQRRIDILELIRIVDVLKAGPSEVFADILLRLGRGGTRRSRR